MSVLVGWNIAAWGARFVCLNWARRAGLKQTNKRVTYVITIAIRAIGGLSEITIQRNEAN